MRKIFAIAGLAIRSAIRSLVVVVLLALLLIAIIALPLTIKGDGTLTGAVQVLLRYTLGAVNIILSIATLWAGCAAIATEVQEHQVHLLVTKPVTRAQLWLGKWLGLLALNAVLLAIAGGMTYGLLHWHLNRQSLSVNDRTTLREELLVARRVVNAEQISVEADAQRIFAEQRRTRTLTKEARPDQVLAAIRQTLLQQAHSLPPNLMLRHVFRVPTATTRPLVLRYKFTSSQTDKNPVACVWLAGAPERPDRFQRPELAAPAGIHTLQVPALLVAADGTLTVDIANVNPEPVTMVFAPADGVQLLVYESSFAANFFRCLLVMLGELTFLGALSVTLGSLFSLPVAALTTAYAVMLMNIGSYLQILTQETFIIGSAAKSNTFDLVIHFLYVGLYWLTKPFQTASPLEPLAVGELESWSWAAGVWGWQVLVIGGILAAVGTWIFNRRELGLPT